MDDPLARYEPIVDEYGAFRAACERPLPSAVRVNPIKASPDEAVRALRNDGVGVERRDWHDGVLVLDTTTPGSTWPYVHGWVHGQEEVSALPATLLDVRPGDAVLDACAAPGSKATQLAGAMDDRGLLVANDDSLGRLAALRSNMDRLGVTCAAVTNRDARDIDLSGLGVDALDAALVDVPCSCEGTVRKNPTTLDDWHESYLDRVSGTQKGILRRAVQLTRSGGRVAYATCTFAPEENEAVLDHVLAREDCRLVDVDLPLDSVPGVTVWRDEEYDPSVAHAHRVYPHHNDTGGFFVALLEVGA